MAIYLDVAIQRQRIKNVNENVIFNMIFNILIFIFFACILF